MTFLMKLVAVVDGAPRTLTLKQAIAGWVEHRREVIARRGGGVTAGGAGENVDAIIADELRAVAARCGDRRRTEIGAWSPPAGACAWPGPAPPPRRRPARPKPP